MLGMQAIRVLGTMAQTNANLFSAGLGIVIGAGAGVLPHDFVMMMQALVRPFVSSGIVMGFLVAAIMHLIFNVMLKAGEKDTEKPRRRAAPTWSRALGLRGYSRNCHIRRKSYA